MKFKLKSHRGAAKRFRRRKSAANPYKCRSAHRNHILTKKSTKRKRHLRKDPKLAAADVAIVRKLVEV